MTTIPIKQFTSGVEVKVPIQSQELVIALDDTVTETLAPMDMSGYTLTFTFNKYDTDNKLVATVCFPGTLSSATMPDNSIVPAAALTIPTGVLDVIGKTKMTVRLELVAQGIDRTPTQELIFKVLPNILC